MLVLGFLSELKNNEIMKIPKSHIQNLDKAILKC